MTILDATIFLILFAVLLLHWRLSVILKRIEVVEYLVLKLNSAQTIKTINKL